jgi:hypothetical protein
VALLFQVPHAEIYLWFVILFAFVTTWLYVRQWNQTHRNA